MTNSMISGMVGGVDAGDAERLGHLDDEERGHLMLPPPNEFERLVQLVRDNEQLSVALDATRVQVHRAWGYLSTPGANTRLALAHLDRLRCKRSAILVQLRANRIAARSLIGLDSSADGFDVGGNDEFLN